MSRHSALMHKLNTAMRSVNAQLEARRFPNLPYVCIDFESGADLPGWEEHNAEDGKRPFLKEYGFDVSEIGVDP